MASLQIRLDVSTQSFPKFLHVCACCHLDVAASAVTPDADLCCQRLSSHSSQRRSSLLPPCRSFTLFQRGLSGSGGSAGCSVDSLQINKTVSSQPRVLCRVAIHQFCKSWRDTGSSGSLDASSHDAPSSLFVVLPLAPPCSPLPLLLIQ